MLKKETITKIASLLKLSEADLTAAITAEAETDLSIPEVSTFSAAELSTRDKSIKSTSYEEGRIAGEEIFIKEAKETLGLKFDGKAKDKFFEAVKKPEAADVEALRKSITDAEAKAASAEKSLNEYKTRSKVVASLPKNLAFDMSQDEQLATLSANGFTFEDSDTGVVVSRHGAVVKDEKLQTPLAVDKALLSFFQEKKWLKEEEQQRQGRGGGSSGGNPPTASKFSEVQKAWEAEGKSVNSSAFSAHVQKIAKDTPDFDYNS